jgi:heterodisulfide reductase subunit A
MSQQSKQPSHSKPSGEKPAGVGPEDVKPAAGKPVGAVLVVGGGIGGIQTSLDLAESGFKVYLLEKNLSIGGTMAQLDKTFPTNDCSMCIMSPKLVDAGRHRNIQILTQAKVERVEGEPGHFKVRVLKKSRSVTLEDCKACGDCAKVCPVKIPNDYEQGLVTRAAVYQLFAQAMPSAYGIEKKGTPPCRAACPLHVNAQGYVALISVGKFKEALALVRETLPFPGILSYACSHPCEWECKRIEEDRPISICRLKKFLVENVDEPEVEFTPPVDQGKSVAVVGSGPAGLTAAYDLRRKGYRVAVFESEDQWGGLLTHGFPSYRLPRDVVEKDLAIIPKMGIELHLGQKVGKDISADTLLSSFDAVFLATGVSSTDAMVHTFKGLKKTRWGTIQVHPVSLETGVKGVFAGGDIATGPGTIVESMAHGRKAAISIDRYLQGEELVQGRASEESTTSPLGTQLASAVRKERETPPDMVKPLEPGFTAEEAMEEAKRCLQCGGCSECMECVKACEAKAIHHELKDEHLEIEVGSIILSPGFDEFQASLKSEYGYGRFPNVVSSIEFERFLSASGPFKGQVVRPSDGNHPKKVAWIQCVGSRDPHIGRGYCSSVCCMYATKEAVIAKEHASEMQATIFFMDMRAYGKDFDKYIERAKKDYGVRYIRSRVSHLKEVPETKNLIIHYETEGGEMVSEEFDLVVLSVGLEPVRDHLEIASVFGIDLNHYGFAKTSTFHPLQTSRPGVFASGVFSGPKDVPETVAQASAAAAEASSLLSESRGTLVTEKEYVPEKNVGYEGPRIGAFICHCGINIGGVVDVPAVVEYARTLPYVVHVTDNIYTCSQDTQDTIKKAIEEHRLNRIFVASCTPRTHEPLFQDTIRQAGLNRYLFEMANIRDQCSWVHMHHPQEATQKAKDLVRMAIAKTALLEPLPTQQVEMVQRALVIGGGFAGMTAALKIAQAGFDVMLIEKEDELGGKAREIYHTIDGLDVQAPLKQLIDEVENHPGIQLLKGTTIEKIDGFVGNFKTRVKTGDETKDLSHGVIVVATGAEEYRPVEFLHGRDKRVTTQTALEKQMLLQPESLSSVKNVVMIQCVGSRNDERPYCSRICCSEAIKNALKLKALRPELNVYVLYRDIRTYGFKEDYYEKARENGVLFIRYDPEREPRVEKVEESLQVTVHEPILHDDLVIHADLLVLSPGVVAPHQNESLSQMLKVPLNADGFFLEAHMKLRPVDFATEGIFLAGLAHSPKSIDETLSQAHAAVARALTYLSKTHLETIGTVSEVDEKKCIGCSLCESLCPYQAIEIVTKRTVVGEKLVAQVNKALCKGCGVCAASCRSGSINLKGFTNEEVFAQINELTLGECV